ncbi:hypothetical protein [Streptomyces sp. Ru73]|uniref:hypothetical protein n=1 Tax=Streptomyces sp. Ru73 TaxID=2080748 RepID=UPI0011B074FB|nr:hypothetical protein [Streptomyces sp. Ru73]
MRQLFPELPHAVIVAFDMGVMGGERLHSDPLTTRDNELARHTRADEYAAADEPPLKQWRGLATRTDELATA